MWYCQHCEKEFVHQSGLSRHVRLVHRKQVEEEEEQMDEEEKSESEAESESENETDNDSSTEEEKADEELTAEDAKRSEKSEAAWTELIQTALAKFKDDGLTNEDLLSDSYFLNQTVPAVMELFDKRMSQCRSMRNSILYEALKKEREYLIDEKGYSKWEAKLKALDNRKYLLRGSIKQALENAEEEYAWQKG